MNSRDKALIEIKDKLLILEQPSRKILNQIKRDIAKKYHLTNFPKNSELLAICDPEEKQILLPILIKRIVRTLSGVAIVAAMTRPWECPHGKCIMCPGGPDIKRPQSYTGFEPTTLRGIRNNYDPYLQIEERVRQLNAIGHSTEKIDAIIMGGTFTNQPIEYQKWFIQRMFDAFNGLDSKTIEEAHKLNETATHRCIGLTAETRPDQICHEKIDHLIDYGVTRIEIGVQTVFDDVYEKMQRGHTTKDTINAFQFIKDSGLKLTAHMMPGLPGSSVERDIKAFDILFNSDDYHPDEVKIYPTMVIPGTKLHQDYLDGKYEPLTNESTARLIATVKENVPPYVRIKRILRDIPAHQIAAGPNKSDLRLDILSILEKEGKKCRCIRCREVGHFIYKKNQDINSKDIELIHRQYKASKGIEHFLSYEDTKNDVIIGFLRLRELSENVIRPEFKNIPTIVVRELHVYGELLGLRSTYKGDLQWQHRGYGRELLLKAEEIGKEKDYSKISVISGIGVREYYRKHGYSLDGPYMSKKL